MKQHEMPELELQLVETEKRSDKIVELLDKLIGNYQNMDVKLKKILTNLKEEEK